MKSLSSILLLALYAFEKVASTSNSWAGSNSYYLHALSDADQTSYIDDLQAAGAKVVRLWGTRTF